MTQAMDRRTILAGLGLAPLAAAPAVAAATETPEERVERLTVELHAALVAEHGGRWRVQVEDEFVIIARSMRR
ncbi:MAG: hypothetical protein JNK47_16865 [Mesorhizobium sp.]|nr:hypothetical protein [Mesorhizobium sp.]MBL8578897.1 hypothetical protein [Mesorhizobium sp.]